ncbi:hypothetical protein DEJ28_07835 [Curtobacterium sp. MCPF17_002]|uniref:hypothetical protein n=1 Tax=Curtobacterium sp. MCPF17_002 TaxID=2175645 RepID=UPI000DA7BE54|nr:hypothetical protein [Curtobacterium sp. MCPF17_002]WIB78997.1 hypothetical protein DEJ28_07835 [Curtobacterium sp. MCPF17_002]
MVDLVVTSVSLAAAYVAAPVAWFWVVLSQMAFDGCSGRIVRCSFDVGTVVVIGHPIVTATVAVIGTCWSAVRRRRHRPTWFVGLATLGSVLGAFVAAEFVTHVASSGHLF